MLTKRYLDKTTANERTNFVMDVLQDVLECYESYDIDDPETQAVIERLFQKVDADNTNIATAAFQMRDEMTLGACLNLVIYCIRAWFTEGGQFTYFYMSSMWMAKRIQALTESTNDKFSLSLKILDHLATKGESGMSTDDAQDFQQQAIKLGQILEEEDNFEVAGKFYLLAVFLIESSDYEVIELLYERLEEVAMLTDDARLKSVVNLLERLKIIAQPGSHNDEISGVINDLKDDFIIRKDVFSHEVDQAILFAIYHHLGKRNEYKDFYEDFKEALTL